MSVDLNLVTYTPADTASANDVLKNGDVGNITNRALEGDTLTITTEKGTFTFSAPGLEDPEAVTPADIGHALDAVNKLSDMDNAMLVDIFALMSLFLQVGNMQRASGREARMAQRDLQMAELGNQVEKLKSAAVMAMAMGIVSGALQVVGGAVQLGFAGSAAKGLADSSKAATGATSTSSKMMQNTDELLDVTSDSTGGAAKAATNIKPPVSTDNLLARGQGWSSIFTGLSGVSNATGQGVSGMMNADATEAQAQATKADNAAQTETDFINAMRDLIKDIQDKLQGILQGEADTMKTILRA